MTTNLLSLHRNLTHRQAQIAQDTAKLALAAPGPTTFAEAADLGRAAFQRMEEMQKSWMLGWADWAGYAARLPETDTVPKFAERLGNIALRAQIQMTTQMTDMAELGENVAVSYGYWVSRQVTERASGTD